MTAVMNGHRLTAADEADALEQLHELGCTDGLPVVIPTPDRVARMVLATGLDADMVLGDMGPNQGVATVEKIAAAAVMAGCTTDHMPLVLAAVKAVIDPRFDLTEMQATTHCTAPLILVNGPARHACGGVAGGSGALGPGHRANASVGRALRLAMINIGGGRPGSSDMALLGHPGKFTYCMAEHEEASPFPPLHTSLGFGIEDSAVTVIGGDSPHSVIFVADADDPESPERLLSGLANAFSNPANNNAALTGGAAVVVLNPDHAKFLADAGHDRASIANAIYERAGNTVGELGKFSAPMGKSVDPEKWIACFRSPDDILVLVGGGGGLYSVVIPTWCAGPHKNRFVTVEVELDQACEIPGMS